MADLAPHIIAILCALALVAGFIDAIAGGGGLIIIPALMAVGIDPVAAIGTNKVQGSVGTASATWSYWRAGLVDVKAMKWPLVMTLIGAAAGSTAILFIDSDWLMVVMPVLLIAIALYFLFGPKVSDEDRHSRLTPAVYALVAAGIGFYDGFFGPGTGSFFALSLVTLLGMGLTRATANTKALNCISNVASVVVLALGGQVLWLLGGMMAVGQFVGGRLGSRAAMRFGPRLIRPLLVAISLGMVVKLLSDPANPLRVMVAAWLA